jgi:hypothetical protein
MQAVLSPGTYTLVLTDANYIPNAVYDNGVLSEGYTDFTGGVFQTCDSEADACITPNGNYALDISSTGAILFAPEPSAFPMMGLGFAALAGLTQFRRRRTAPQIEGGAQ